MTQSELEKSIRQNSEKLYRISYLYLGNEEDAKDALQEAITKAFLCLHQLREDTLFDTWLCRILINECKSALRRKKRESEHSFALTPEPHTPDSSEQSDLRLDMEAALRQLSDREREQIALHYFQAMPIRDISRMSCEKEGTVSSRISRGLKKLRRIWAGEIK